jgi:aerobic carbon-monoxide dehydrogenase large subunit
MSAVEQAVPSQKWVGQAMRRKEDPRMITGRGRYVDDFVLPGMLYMAIVRSPEAHARITSIDASGAKSAPGVHGVFTADDLKLESPLPMAWVPPGVEVKAPETWPLAKGVVKYVGQAVAVVVGSDKYGVVDAAEQVLVDYDPLPVVVDPEKALEPASPLVHEEIGTNQTHEWTIGGGDMDAAWANADVVIERRIVNHRTAGAPIEPRACVADYRGGSLTLHITSQNPHLIRLFMAGEFGMSEDRIRVVAPDVGGGFGVKISHYGEEIIAAWASKQLGRPVKWTETRSEHMTSTIHGRDQIDYVKVGARRDGTITGLECTAICDLGAYYTLLTPFIPCFTGFVISGCYKIPNLKYTARGVFTNKMATDATRGAGRPEATHLIEVTVEQLAHELGMDPIEIRRKNFIPTEDFPAEVAIGLVYDSGDYHGSLDKLLTHVDVDAFRAEQEELRAKGVFRGIGFSTWMEICGLAPSRVVGPSGVGLQAGFYESAVVRVHASGSVTAYSGTAPHGQGLDTSFAQIVADRVGVTPDEVDVIHGDTSAGPFGLGTYGSRSLAVGGESLARSALKVADKAKRIASHLLEAAPEDIELADGKFAVKGSPDKGMTLAEIAGAAYIPENLPEGMEPGLEETTFYDPENFTFPFGAHACIVEVDVETGKIEVKRYVSVDDCGPAINPMLIEGQIHGGIVHALGQALFERIHYDEQGQLVTGTFVDYALPSAADVPSFETDRTETPSPVNSLGVKGVGEAGTIAASPAVTNAVIDALRPLGVDYIDMPLSPQRVWATIEAAKAHGRNGGGAR